MICRFCRAHDDTHKAGCPVVDGCEADYWVGFGYGYNYIMRVASESYPPHKENPDSLRLGVVVGKGRARHATANQPQRRQRALERVQQQPEYVQTAWIDVKRGVALIPKSASCTTSRNHMGSVLRVSEQWTEDKEFLGICATDVDGPGMLAFTRELPDEWTHLRVTGMNRGKTALFVEAVTAG